MDWQEVVCVIIVAFTAGVFLWRLVRPRKFRFQRDTTCGCSSVHGPAPQHAVIFHARKGERPQVLVKIK
jgi:hypothetical protein